MHGSLKDERRSPDEETPADEVTSGREGEPVAEEEASPTPFDHPLFLPGLFLAFAVWFGYDAYFNQDPEMLEHLEFNRFGLRVMVWATALSGLSGWAELRARPVPPYGPAVVLGALALWFAYDGWLSGDPFYEDYRAFNRTAAGALAVVAGWMAAAGTWRARGQREPAWVLPALTLAAAGLFGWRAAEVGDHVLLDGSTGTGLVVVGLWQIRRALSSRGDEGDRAAT